MYKTKGAVCTTCHDGDMMPAPPTIKGDKIDMRQGTACASCHSASRRSSRAPALFISSMPAYDRCSDCHTIAGSGDGGGWGGGGWGGDSGGGWGGGGWGGR
jgi:hypothetical protein